MIRYLAANGLEVIELADTAISHMLRYRQARSSAKEAGGQLFASFSSGLVRVERASGPSLFDRRSRFSFLPSNRNAAKVIRDFHRRGLHYVGDWHTHPEARPSPSADDLRSIHSAYRESVHHLSGFLMVIVGTEPPPHGLFAALADGHDIHPLRPLTELIGNAGARNEEPDDAGSR